MALCHSRALAQVDRRRAQRPCSGHSRLMCTWVQQSGGHAVQSASGYLPRPSDRGRPLPMRPQSLRGTVRLALGHPHVVQRVPVPHLPAVFSSPDKSAPRGGDTAGHWAVGPLTQEDCIAAAFVSEYLHTQASGGSPSTLRPPLGHACSAWLEDFCGVWRSSPFCRASPATVECLVSRCLGTTGSPFTFPEGLTRGSLCTTVFERW